ncbi:torso-like protein [Anthonomus grandis grandis]|uniref:torso-like protein n=1 Tax=Anthonomus grandis grandis TaxID=2921223 RepID=UPI002165EC16|nr:torso-like protein [Anthonomus grandis grandis]
MRGRARLLVLPLLLVALTTFGLNGVVVATSADDENQLKVGRSIDIFSRFGYLSLSMKVVPRNDTDWIFREPTIDIFDDMGRYLIQPARSPRKQRRVFDGDFHMEFCDNLKQLVQAYFRDFSFELLEQPWKAFTSSWSAETLARNLGVTSGFVTKDFCYVLVRLSRFWDSAKLGRSPRSVNVVDIVKEEIDGIKVGDAASVLLFMKKYGSHYIQSYVTGNSLYQVFVFNKTRYHQIKDRLKNQGISHISESELNQYFSPWQAEHVGLIKTASGNKTVEEWASSKLRQSYFIFTYSTLLKSKGDSRLLTRLNNLLRNEAILGMDMKSLGVVIEDQNKKLWFDEVLDNVLKLWESNL